MFFYAVSMDHNSERISVLEANFVNMQKQLESIENKVDKVIVIMEEKYVTKEQFSIVKNVVYGMVATILL
jgi:tetrahydromethanopterin S-methyltransferase subunit G